MIFSDVEAENDIAPAGLSKSLPRHQVRSCLSEGEKAGAVETFFTVVKEELDIVPARAQVIEYVQENVVFVERPRADYRLSQTEPNSQRMP